MSVVVAAITPAVEEPNIKRSTLPAKSDAPIDTEQVMDPDATTGSQPTTEAEKLAQLYPSLYHHNPTRTHYHDPQHPGRNK